ncbi:MAG: hypothetical protein KDA25_00390 [Phycisphaerales bacterium]|nr:hypothetical protein [Phycisphaerales bacterium]
MARPRSRPRPRRRARPLARAVAWTGGGLATLAILAWAIGQLMSDGTWWSQWLSWIPTPVALAASFVAAVASYPAGRRFAGRWAIVFIVLATWFLAFEHRFLRPGDGPREGLRVVHWNLTHCRPGGTPNFVNALIGLDGDVTVLSNPGSAPGAPEITAWLGPEGRVSSLGTFAVLSRLPILRCEWIGANDAVFVGLAEIDATSVLGRPIIIYMLDLPSDPELSRLAIAEQVGRFLDAKHLPPPDLVVGDFNMLRDSRAIRLMFPEAHHAFDEAGRGFGASYPRRWPVFHLDHLLLSSDWRASRYDLVDPGVGRHRAQIGWIVPAGAPAP